MRILVITASALALTGCALTDASLDVSHDAEVVQPGPLSETESLTFVRGTLDDLRQDVERIGYKNNSLGMKTADIRTDEPITDIVMAAIEHAVESNGHLLGDSGIEISGAVNHFWVESDMNFWSVEVIGDVEATLSFTDTDSGASLYSRAYKGTYSDKVQVVTDGAYNKAISGAINSLIDEIVFDEDLADALRQP